MQKSRTLGCIETEDIILRYSFIPVSRVIYKILVRLLIPVFSVFWGLNLNLIARLDCETILQITAVICSALRKAD